eukprot:1148714-Prorocentrum_minimum.AAC.1
MGCGGEFTGCGGEFAGCGSKFTGCGGEFAGCSGEFTGCGGELAALYSARLLNVHIGHTGLQNGTKRLTAHPFVIHPGRVTQSAGLFANVHRDWAPAANPHTTGAGAKP